MEFVALQATLVILQIIYLATFVPGTVICTYVFVSVYVGLCFKPPRGRPGNAPHSITPLWCS